MSIQLTFGCLILFALPGLACADDLFQDQVRPLLEKKCLGCHNSSDRKGGLSLETSQLLKQGGDSGAVLVPGKPEESYLLELITPADGKAEMPKGGQPLSSQEQTLVREWISRGAPWPAQVTLAPEVWWSLKPLVRPQVPAGEPLLDVNGTTVPVRTPVDAFIQRTLKSRGLVPAVEADRRVLIRRLYFDLIGLPPTPDEIDRFIADPDPRAYELLVDRLLESPQYGERWARHWLDIARYADTCGYDKDKLRRNAWPYRDYVIRSFNDDKRYDRFVQEQLAGDILYPGTADGILGLGFIAAGPWDNIGHAEVSESKIDGQIARMMDRDEMVSGALNAFCSTTVQCARCHDHKFDPITQEHYYGLQAVFAAVDRAERAYDVPHEIEQQRLALQLQLQQSRQQLSAVAREIDQAVRDNGEDRRLAALKADLDRLKPGSPPERPAQYGYHSQISDTPETPKWVEVDLGDPVDIQRVVLHPCFDDYAGIGGGFGFPIRFRVELASDYSQLEPGGEPVAVIDRTGADLPGPGLKPVEFLVEAPGVRWVRVTATRLAKRSDDYIFALGELEVFGEGQRNLALHSPARALDSIESAVRWSLKNLTDGLWPAYQREELITQYETAKAAHDDLLKKYETPERIARREEAGKSIERLQRELEQVPAGRMVYAAATEFTPQGAFQPTHGKPREIRILHRGNVQEPLQPAVPGAIPVIAGVPAVFDLPPEHTEGDRRAALAAWIVRLDHPLTWRSVVNRIWQFHFGDGLVASPNDFGHMGQEPTHPELLDWLAVEFRDNGQSFKQMHRLLVTSSVYRQSSEHHAGNAAIDGSNLFLWRMNRRRLEAEEIRDSLLSVSGCLNCEMGGPGFFLFELEKEAHSPHYEYDHFDPANPGSHRRSVYRFIVRSQPDPYMTTLDCADSSQSTPRRSETVTALQALALLNNRFNLVMAEKFAARLAALSPEQSTQISVGFELVTGRPITPEEQQELDAYADEFGMPNLCRVLFNLNEFVYVD